MSTRTIIARLGPLVLVLAAAAVVLIGRGTGGQPAPAFGAPGYPTCIIADSNASTGGAAADITLTGPRADALCQATADRGGADFSVVSALPTGHQDVCTLDHGAWHVAIGGDASMQLMGQGACTTMGPDLVAIIDEVSAGQQGQAL